MYWSSSYNCYLLLGFLFAEVSAALFASSCLFNILSRVTVLVSPPAVIKSVSSDINHYYLFNFSVKILVPDLLIFEIPFSRKILKSISSSLFSGGVSLLLQMKFLRTKQSSSHLWRIEDMWFPNDEKFIAFWYNDFLPFGIIQATMHSLTWRFLIVIFTGSYP